MPLFGAFATPVDITPSWKGDSADPAIGNGSIAARACRIGNFIWFNCRVTMGSTTTFGTGNWYLTLPAPFDLNAVANAEGGCFELDSGTAIFLGIPFIASGTKKIYITAHNSANFFNSGVPQTWANGDYFEFTIIFPVA